MSFQDVGRGGASSRKANIKIKSSAQPSISPIAENSISSNGDQSSSGGRSSHGYNNTNEQISDAILQYQRNVGILEKINKQIGSKTDGPVLQTQFRVQVDVIKQLGQKIEQQLKVLESNTSSTSSSSARAAYIKLNRDYQRVITSFKNLQLEAKRKWDFMEAQRRERAEDKRKNAENVETDQKLRLQMVQEQDRLNEYLIREREAEIRNINKGMHQVNEIYKDLAHLVGNQQEDIDQIETNMEEAAGTAKDGLYQVEKANAAQSNCVIS